MGNQEKIGSVVLDLSYYSGEDIYTDGAVEDEMLEIVKNNRGKEKLADILSFITTANQYY